MYDVDVTMTYGGYRATFSSRRGGICHSLTHLASGLELLRTPNSEEDLLQNVFLYGNPILFPCNRIRGGKFTFEGREYSFPINEISTNCHLHGELYKKPFSIESVTENAVTFGFHAEKCEYLGFPHSFTVERRYSLSSSGLEEKTIFYNLSDQNMPLMLAFHTTFNAPNGKVKLPVISEQLRDEHFLPTGDYAQNRPVDAQMTSGEYVIGREHLSKLYAIMGTTASIALGDYEIEYSASPEYGYRMMYSPKESDFISLEPQSCAIDAFHLPTPAEKNGLIVVKPREKIELFTQISVKEKKIKQKENLFGDQL